MWIVAKPWFPKFLQRLITLAMVIGAAIIIFLPAVVYFSLELYERNYSDYFFISRLCLLYPSGILGFMILFEAREMLKRINNDNPFVYENARRIKHIAVYSAGLCVLHGAGAIFIHSFFIPIFFIVFGLTALLVAVLGELFYKAVKYKEENDYTI